MKSKMFFIFIALLSATVISCSDDNEAKRKGDADVAHDGAEWKVTSAEYMLIDQSTSGQTFKSGTKADAGSFYFVDGSNNGSFEMNIEGYNKEDLFNYTIDSNNGVSIIDIEQTAGVTTNQNILVLTGDRTSDTEMTLDGTITKQSTSGQFVLTVTVTLVKK